MSVLVRVNTSAGDPRMHKDAAARFDKLRQIVFENSGVDFLAKCGDVLRPADYISSKDGVANRSWHKTGRAFDYDQTSDALIIVSEPQGTRQFFLTYLICADQSGRHGVLKSLKDMRGFKKSTYVFDFTAAAESQGFKRIPAWNGWQKKYNRREFWHYQFDEGLTWNAAMLRLAYKTRTETIIGLNDRGQEVEKIQNALFTAGLLPATEIDGVFGAKTRNAVAAFQRLKGLDADSLVGPKTRSALQI